MTTSQLVGLVIASGVALMAIAWRCHRAPVCAAADTVSHVTPDRPVHGGSAGEFRAVSTDAGVRCMCVHGEPGCDCR